MSILIVARDTGAFINDALLSARAQSFANLEIVVVDDGSTDDTRAIALRHVAQDARVRVLDGPGAGLAAARNASLGAARGRWCAILDSDDLIHPDHIARLVATAERTGADIVAANMVNFATQDGLTRTSLFAVGTGWEHECEIRLSDFVRANGPIAHGVVTGYLKPLISATFLARHALGYDIRLRIAEDYDLIARALAAGARYVFQPRPTYFYRRHAESTSHRLAVSDLEAMLATARSAAAGSPDQAVLRAVADRTRRLRVALAHACAIEALKNRQPFAALRALGGDVRAWHALGRSVIEGARRRLRRGAAAVSPTPPPAPSVLVLGEAGDGPGLVDARRPVLHRAAPRDDAERAARAHELPPLARIVVGAPATLDDAAYLMAPAVVREPASAASRSQSVNAA